MKKTKTLAETLDISKDLYLDRSLYEHDHKGTHTQDVKTLVKFSISERKDKVADRIVATGIMYN